MKIFKVLIIITIHQLRRILGKLLPKFSLMNVLESFPIYAPSSAGKYGSKSKITKQTINNLPKFLENLGRESFGKTSLITQIEGFPSLEVGHKNEKALKALFDHHGSDKANSHNYHIIYSSILGDGEKTENIFEIGLGTNNSDVVSHMGRGGNLEHHFVPLEIIVRMPIYMVPT